MKKNVLAICGHEKAYVKRLFSFVHKKYGEKYDVFLFTKEEALKAFVKENNIFAVIADEDFNCEEFENIENKLFLSGEKDKDKIYRYQPCDEILKEVMAVCAAGKAKEDICYKGEKNLIGIYSPVKRSFQTTFALTLGQILAKDHKVLYLNFEWYSGFQSLCSKETKTDLADLIYFSECGAQNFAMHIESIKEQLGKLDYISPVSSMFKLYEIGKEKWETLLTNLLEKTDYEFIILDLSEAVRGLFDVLKKCNRIYTITDDDRTAIAKITQYEEMIRDSVYEEIIRKTKNIVIPRFREIPSSLEMLPFTELADYIKGLIKKEEEENLYGEAVRRD